MVACVVSGDLEIGFIRAPRVTFGPSFPGRPERAATFRTSFFGDGRDALGQAHDASEEAEAETARRGHQIVRNAHHLNSMPLHLAAQPAHAAL